MEAAAIPEIKEALRRVSVAECETVAQAALGADSADEIEGLLARAFAPRLYDLLTGSTVESLDHGANPGGSAPSHSS
jgi:phosphoenolpyruvate-protein phosphotransferase (PTS system enzyme I)